MLMMIINTQWTNGLFIAGTIGVLGGLGAGLAMVPSPHDDSAQIDSQLQKDWLSANEAIQIFDRESNDRRLRHLLRLARNLNDLIFELETAIHFSAYHTSVYNKYFCEHGFSSLKFEWDLCSQYYEEIIQAESQNARGPNPPLIATFYSVATRYIHHLITLFNKIRRDCAYEDSSVGHTLAQLGDDP